MLTPSEKEKNTETFWQHMASIGEHQYLDVHIRFQRPGPPQQTSKLEHSKHSKHFHGLTSSMISTISTLDHRIL